MWRKNYENKTVSEWTWDIYSYKYNNLRLQIVQPEFTTGKYKVKLSAETANGGAL